MSFVIPVALLLFVMSPVPIPLIITVGHGCAHAPR